MLLLLLVGASHHWISASTGQYCVSMCNLPAGIGSTLRVVKMYLSWVALVPLHIPYVHSSCMWSVRQGQDGVTHIDSHCATVWKLRQVSHSRDCLASGQIGNMYSGEDDVDPRRRLLSREHGMTVATDAHKAHDVPTYELC